MTSLPLASVMIFLPLITALVIVMSGALLSYTQNKSPKLEIDKNFYVILTLTSTLASLFLSLYAAYNVDNADFTEYHRLISVIGLNYHVNISKLSIIFIVLINLLTISAVLISINSIKKDLKEYLICFLLLQFLSVGFFSAENLLLFYCFFEATLIPMYIIIGVWGGENKVYAAIKFFLYTFAGSIFFLISLIFMYKLTNTFDMKELVVLLPKLPLETQKWLWLGACIAFAVKIPMFPFHTWLPDAHVQAPTAGSVMLAGILLKIGGYGMLKVLLPMLPAATQFFADYIIIFSVVAIIYGSLVAMAQTDMKKMIAYSSVAHMGYVTAGIFSLNEIGIVGAVFQMISHGLISAGLFLVVGILYERNHAKEIAAYGGWAAKMPILASIFMVYMLGSIGLPGTSGFIGEFFSLTGIFKDYAYLAVVAAGGVVLGAVYMLKLYKDIMFGEVKVSSNTEICTDVKLNEIIALIPLLLLIIAYGIYPKLILQFLKF